MWYQRARVRAHPRSRGENWACGGTVRGLRGSSPLTRGKLERVARARGWSGLIPAHAGKTRGAAGHHAQGAAHPRSRGENLLADPSLIIGAGSSPLTRGKPPLRVAGSPRTRLIPAHAGKTPRASRQSPQTQAHPRSRGENDERRLLQHGRRGSSPLTRGKPRMGG